MAELPELVVFDAPRSTTVVQGEDETDLVVITPGGPQGEQGAPGIPGPPNSLTIGTVVPAATAGATITGTAPEQVLNLELPQGEQGLQGEQGETGGVGPPGPANTLTIGTVVDGGAADATITGAAPNQTLNLVLPQGPEGPQGIPGEPGGAVVLDDLTDVDLSTAAEDGQALVYDTGTSSWKPGSVAGAACSLTRVASGTLAATGANTSAQMPWDTLTGDSTGAMWNAAQPAQIVIPADGWYHVTAQIGAMASMTSWFRIDVRVNGTVEFMRGFTTGGTDWPMYLTTKTVQLVAGDAVTVYYENRSAAAPIWTTEQASFLTVHKVA